MQVETLCPEACAASLETRSGGLRPVHVSQVEGCIPLRPVEEEDGRLLLRCRLQKKEQEVARKSRSGLV